MPKIDDILLSVKDLKIYFRSDGELARAVDGISFDIRREETVCLVGESGCGKSVTALSVLGLNPRPPGEIAGGRILFNDQDLLDCTEAQMRHIRGNQIAMVFQEPLSSLNPVFTVGDQIKEAIMIHENTTAKDLEARCLQLLKRVGIPAARDRINDYPHQLSGGQRQRVMIAMALACNPALVLADEPTTALDVTVQSQILNLFTELQRKLSMSVMYITHDLGVVKKVADRVYVMYAGIIVEQGAKNSIFDAPGHPYTRALLASIPHRSKRGKRLFSIPGSVPNPAHKPAGCPFHPRCPFTVSRCREQFPQMCNYGSDHLARCPVVYGKWRNGVVE